MQTFITSMPQPQAGRVTGNRELYKSEEKYFWGCGVVWAMGKMVWLDFVYSLIYLYWRIEMHDLYRAMLRIARTICCVKVSVRPPICHDPVLYQNGLTYRRNYFQHHSSFLRTKTSFRNSDEVTLNGARRRWIHCRLGVKNAIIGQ